MRQVSWGAVALVAGMLVGWLDLSAGDVQGPLLLLMAASFAVAFSSRLPGWLVGALVFAGLPLVMAIGGVPQWAVAIALLPSIGAAYAGRLAGTLVSSAARGGAIDRELLGGALIACALLGAVPVYATLVARGQRLAWWITILWQVMTFAGWILLTPFIIRGARAAIARAAAPAAIAAQVATVTGLAVVHAAILMAISRALFVPVTVTPEAIAWSAAGYVPLDALVYLLTLALAHLSDADRLTRSARAAALRVQLRPHFFFNALNAASVLARRGDAGPTTEMLAALADLLRYVLDEGDEMVPLRRELDFVQRYLAVERIRFADRMTSSIDAAGDTLNASVPHLLLQPLVENAVRHGVNARTEGGEVRVRAWREEALLHIAVEDDGPGPGSAADTEGDGIGLRNTRSRLETSFGDEASFSLNAGTEGGAVAHLVLPYRPWDDR